MITAVHITWHGAQINFGDLPPYLTYDVPVLYAISCLTTDRLCSEGIMVMILLVLPFTYFFEEAIAKPIPNLFQERHSQKQHGDKRWLQSFCRFFAKIVKYCRMQWRHSCAMPLERDACQQYNLTREFLFVSVTIVCTRISNDCQ